MAEIIKFDSSRKKSKEKSGKTGDCLHKNVTVYENYRTVRCSFCGTLLDPFDVLLSMVQGYIPADPFHREETLMTRELLKREEKARKREEKTWD